MKRIGVGKQAMKKKQGLILVFTGNGKGKTTAAMGCALRMIGHGKRVGMVQFFKRRTPNSVLHTKFKIWSFGGGFTWEKPREANRLAVDKAWEKCVQLLHDPRYGLVIFDEINMALKYKFLRASNVIRALKKKPVVKHVILTGRGAPEALLKAADLVTEMRCVKHPFSCGVLAQAGIEF